MRMTTKIGIAAANEIVDANNTIILHKTGGIAKKLTHSDEKKIRDIIKAAPGPELVLQRSGGSFTFEVDVKESEDDWIKKPVRESTVDMLHRSVIESHQRNDWFRSVFYAMRVLNC